MFDTAHIGRLITSVLAIIHFVAASCTRLIIDILLNNELTFIIVRLDLAHEGARAPLRFGSEGCVPLRSNVDIRIVVMTIFVLLSFFVHF